MAELNEGHGVTYTFAGITLPPIAMEVPGWVKEFIDLTNLDNSDVKTAKGAALRKIKDFKMRTAFDPAEIDGLPEGSAAFVITFPNSGGTITIHCEIIEVDNIPLENDTRPVYELNFGVTNLAAGVETPPAYAA